MGVKGKREIYPSPCCEGIHWSRDRDVLFLNFSATSRWRWSVNFTPQALYLWKRH